jgi:hypothetical protein
MPIDPVTRVAVADNASIPFAKNAVASSGILTENGGYISVCRCFFKAHMLSPSFV